MLKRNEMHDHDIFFIILRTSSCTKSNTDKTTNGATTALQPTWNFIIRQKFYLYYWCKTRYEHLDLLCKWVMKPHSDAMMRKFCLILLLTNVLFTFRCMCTRICIDRRRRTQRIVICHSLIYFLHLASG